jgi:hypothetical protein
MPLIGAATAETAGKGIAHLSFSRFVIPIQQSLGHTRKIGVQQPHGKALLFIQASISGCLTIGMEFCCSIKHSIMSIPF